MFMWYAKTVHFKLSIIQGCLLLHACYTCLIQQDRFVCHADRLGSAAEWHQEEAVAATG